MRWNVSIALRVAGLVSENLLCASVLLTEFAGLPLPVHGVAAFLPAVPHVPCVAKLPVQSDTPHTHLVLRVAVGPAFDRRVQHATGDHKPVRGAGVECVARQLGAQFTRRERLA